MKNKPNILILAFLILPFSAIASVQLKNGWVMTKGEPGQVNPVVMAKKVDLEGDVHIIGYGDDPHHPRHSIWSYYFSGELGASYVNWDKAYSSKSLKNAYSITAFSGKNNFSNNMDMMGRFDFAVAYKNQYITEIAFNLYQKTKWSSTATLNNAATGPFSIRENQDAIEMLFGYNIPLERWDVTALIGAARISDRNIRVNDDASSPTTNIRYKNDAFYTLAYGLQTAYTFYSIPKLSITLSLFGMLNKNNISFKPSSGNRRFSIDMPNRESLLVGVRYRI